MRWSGILGGLRDRSSGLFVLSCARVWHEFVASQKGRKQGVIGVAVEGYKAATWSSVRRQAMCL